MAQTPTIECQMKVDLEPLRNVAELTQIFIDVQDEIVRARAKHGAQFDLPMGTGATETILAGLDRAACDEYLYTDEYLCTLDTLDNASLATAAKRLCADGGTGDGTGGDAWAKVLFEEVTEALAESDDESEHLDEELVQVIAMGVSMLQALRRQRKARA